MAERARSKDHSRETEAVLGESPEKMEQTPGQGGRKGGEIQRKVGTRDEQKLNGGRTTPKAQDQDDSGDKENV